MDTEERLAALEKTVGEYDVLLTRLMLLAAKHPIGRKILKQLAKES